MSVWEESSGDMEERIIERLRDILKFELRQMKMEEANFWGTKTKILSSTVTNNESNIQHTVKNVSYGEKEKTRKREEKERKHRKKRSRR